MEHRVRVITCKENKNVKIGNIPGHFATNHSHVNHYLDMGAVKSQSLMAQRAAEVLARHYATATPVETILCMEGTEVLGAFLARELSVNSPSLSAGQDICVITPELNANNQMIFRDNMQKRIWNRQILLLVASVSTGKTISRLLDCLQYYSGRLAGIAAIFSAIPEQGGVPIRALFGVEDLPGYETYPSHECPQCQEKKKIDAIVNSFGYSKV